MTTRSLLCPQCGHRAERTAIGLAEPPRNCEHCDAIMNVMPSFPAGLKFKGEGFHAVDYPKNAAQKIKDFGLEQHDSTNPMADYHQEGYAEEMASKAPSQNLTGRAAEVEEFAKSRGRKT